jgi:hypothetical protein
MDIYDIIPTEPLWEVIDDKLDPPETWYQDDLINSIREEGFRYSLNVDPNGLIRNGNARYWVARKLLEEENDQRFRYLPVQQNFVSGYYHVPFKLEFSKELVAAMTTEEKEKMYYDTMSDLTLKMFKEFQETKQLLIPSKTEFEEYEQAPDDPIFLTTHYDRTTGDYVSFYAPHPERQEEMFFICILEGHRTFDQGAKDPKLKEHFDKVIRDKPAVRADFLRRQREHLAKREQLAV